MRALTEKIESLPIEMLKDVLAGVSNRFEQGTDLVFEMCLNRLESLLSENEFCQFCENLN